MCIRVAEDKITVNDKVYSDRVKSNLPGSLTLLSTLLRLHFIFLLGLRFVQISQPCLRFDCFPIYHIRSNVTKQVYKRKA